MQQCEKWSNNGPEPYWAVWYPINAHPAHSVVLKAHYILPDSLPHSLGFTLNYTFSNFYTGPIHPEQFTPPKQWLTLCTNFDGGLQKTNHPDRQGGCVCVSPSKKNIFSLALRTKPVHDVYVQIHPCGPFIEGAGCKNCVQFSSTKFWTK